MTPETEAPALVTGAAGFVGSAVARALLAQGRRVRVLVREGSLRDNLLGLDVEIATGDLRDPAAVATALRGAGALFHVAADYRLWLPRPDEMVENNVGMTRVVMEAALAAGTPRIVYTSSVATLRVHTDGSDSDETQPLDEAQAIGAYKRSKVAAERLIERMVAERGLPAVIVNPSTPIGPRDVKPTPTGRLVMEAAQGRIPAYVDTGLNLVHVDDVASGHLAAERQGKVGERYVLGGDNVALGRMLADIAQIAGRAAPKLQLPRRALFPIAYAAEFAARFTGREPMATVDGLKMAKYKMYFSSAKAAAELGYRARPYREALAEAVAWLRDTGRL